MGNTTVARNHRKRRYAFRRAAQSAALALIILTWGVLSLAFLWPWIAQLRDTTPPLRLPPAAGYNYLIIAPKNFRESALEWADYRRQSGYQVKVALLDEQQRTTAQVAKLIRETYFSSQSPYPFFVLILGHAHTEIAHPESYIPTYTLPITPQEADIVGYDTIAGDSGYAFDPETNTWLPIIIGRLPFFYEEWVFAKLADVRQYEKSSLSALQRRQVELIASDANWGDAFALLMEAGLREFARAYLPPDVNLHTIYGYPRSVYSLPLEKYPREVLSRFNAGALWVSYVGHGSDYALGPATSLDGTTATMLDYQSVVDFPLAMNNTIVTFTACAVGTLDSSSDIPSLAELLTMPIGGKAIATFAASRITFEIPNTFLQKDLMLLLFDERVQTLGEWVQRAKFGYANPALDSSLTLWLFKQFAATIYNWLIIAPDCPCNFEDEQIYLWHLWSYNLFGDPALRIARYTAQAEISPALFWQPFGIGGALKFSGHIEADAGKLPKEVQVFLKPAPGSDIPVKGENRSQWQVYQTVNRAYLGQSSAKVLEDGSFRGEIGVPAATKSGKYVLEVIGGEAHGMRVVYLGFPLAELLRSKIVWWSAITLYLLLRLRRRKSIITNA